MTSPETLADVDAARRLAAAGIPVFVAPPDPKSSTGYALPRNWQHAQADPAVVDAWRPGMAIAAVMGHGLDVIDIDPRNGGDPAMLNGRTPVSYGVALTPSGGVHSFIRSLGVHKKTNLMPGIDLQAGAPDGSGRGFVFLAPTVRTSKATGEPVAYRWAVPLDLPRWQTHGPADVSGLALAELVRASATAPSAPSAEEFMKSGPWANVEAALSSGRNNGVARLAAALRGRGGWREEDALRFMYAEVWPLVDQQQGGHEFTADEFEATIRAQFKQYPDGAEQRAQEREQAVAAPPPTTPMEAPSLLRYFTEKNALQAATLAGDVVSLGPLANGVDDIMWAYRSGVWRPAKHIVRDRVTFLLGERYRPGHTRNVEDIVRGRVGVIDCDPVPQFINMRNGLLDWRTGQLREHTPEVPSTVQLNVEYDPGAQCPVFEQFLSEVVPPDVVDTAWELIGYLMYSGNPLHKAVMLTGTGRNGKGTFLRVMTTLLGRANVTTASLHDLVNTRFTTASLFGKLANIAGDIDGSYLENTATLKGITGGDMISAEHKNRDRFDFSPWAVPVFSANKIPGSADTTVGYLSRWLIVNFPHDFTGRENRGLDAALGTARELAGIAARGLAALPRLLQRGDFMVTESAQAAREDFVRRVDQVRTWLFDCADLHPDHPWIARTELYQSYQRWAVRDGHRPVKASEFYDRIEAAGGEPAIVRGTRGFKRIKIIDGGHPYLGGAAGAGPTHSVSYTSVPAPQPVAAAVQVPQAAQGAAAATEPAPSQSPVNAGAPNTQGAEGAPKSLSPNAPVYACVCMSPGGGTCTTCTLDAPPSIAGTITAKLQAAAAAAPRPPVEDRQPAAAPVPEAVPTKRAKIDPAVKAAAKAAERQAQLEVRIAEAAGPLVDLPAVVTRDGTVTHLELGAVPGVAETFGWDAELTVDVETTGYPIGHADFALRTVQLGCENIAVVLDAGDQAHLDLAAGLLRAAAVLHAHSATADLVPLAEAGAVQIDDAWSRMHDTVIPAKLADPQSTGSDPGLKQLAHTVLGATALSPAADAARAELFKAGKWLTDTKPTTPIERSGWAQVNPRCTTMIRYAASDVLDDAALARRLPPVAPPVLERERTAQRMTATVAHLGVRIDGELVDAKLVEHRDALAAAGRRLQELGVDNPGSDQQVGARLASLGAALERTKTGRPSVAKGVLDPFAKDDGPIGELVRARLDYQHHETVLGLFLEPYAQLVHRGDGRARPTVYTLAADTGRMSCVRPNFQQVPRQGGIRSCITADPGEVIVSADFASVEIRVAAALTGDTNLARMLAAGRDLHMETAKQAYGPEATKEDRYNTKRGVFGRLYGSGIAGIARTLGVSEAEAAAIVASLDAMTPEMTRWITGLKQAVQGGMTTFETYAGRVVHLDPKLPHKAFNYCVQGTARELLVDALMRWQHTRWGRCRLVPVHDEVLVFVPEDDAQEATDALVACMQSSLYGVDIKAEASAPSFEWKDAS